MSEHLDDDGLVLMAEKAALGLPALSAHLDDVTGVNGERWLSETSGLKNAPLEHSSLQFTTLNSEDPELLIAMATSPAFKTIDRVVASIRLLQIPLSKLPSSCQPAEYELLCDRAQQQLSALLVDHPVLLHPRIFIKSLPISGAEMGPIAHVIANSPRIEFPRARHGVDLAKIEAFAKHPCVRVGFTSSSPFALNREAKKYYRFQGITLVRFISTLSRSSTRALVSIMELDDLRRKGLKKAPASFLAVRDGNVATALQIQLRRSFQVACGLVAPDASSFELNADGFIAALAKSGHLDVGMLLPNLSTSLWSWGGVSNDKKADSLRALVHGLVALQPPQLRTPTQEVMGQPSTTVEAAQWVIRGMLQGSSSGIKRIPQVDGAGAAAFVDVMVEFDPEGAASGRLYDQIESALAGNYKDYWVSALTARRMANVIKAADAEAPVQAPASIPLRRSRVL
ncbi:hypothetical protein [Paucibacter soli]|uniref:hypothetical protein n=1 Tax=Paucibacter soli TaxID=3133433 RepID=UPI00309E94FC